MRADLDQVVGDKANDLLAVRNHLKGGDWNQMKATTSFGHEPVQGVLADLDREAAFRRLYGEAVQGSNTANRTVGAEAVDIRKPSTGGDNSDITLGTLAGGPAGAARAVGVKGARYGWGWLGRRSDIARNDQMAEAVTRQGSDLDLLIDTVRGRSEAAKDIDSYAGRRAQLIAQARLASEGRQEHVSQRARALGQALLAR